MLHEASGKPPCEKGKGSVQIELPGACTSFSNNSSNSQESSADMRSHSAVVQHHRHGAAPPAEAAAIGVRVAAALLVSRSLAGGHRPFGEPFVFRLDSGVQRLLRIRLREETDGENNAGQGDAS